MKTGIRAMLIFLLVAFAGDTFAHGLIQDPPARNWFCGAVTKPDHVQNGTAQYPGVRRRILRARRRAAPPVTAS